MVMVTVVSQHELAVYNSNNMSILVAHSSNIFLQCFFRTIILYEQPTFMNTNRNAPADEAYHMTVRMPCCHADCHQAFMEQFYQGRQCILCSVALTRTGDDDLMDAIEYIFLRRERTLNNDIRRHKDLPYTVVPIL